MIELFLPVFAITLFFILLACLITVVDQKFKVDDANPLVEKINAILPQTQCGQCGYPGCKPYAQAISEGSELINKCPPGGQRTITELAALLNIEPPELDAPEETPERVAYIDEDLCIGCTKCIQACPVDAIVGAAKQMHTVIKSECTGCDLCVEPCPVDCIYMVNMQIKKPYQRAVINGFTLIVSSK